jgi:outer membrane protein OmpA-like peptidoglycan-associated protein
MALSKENQSHNSQLEGLLDLLMDLQILNEHQESSKESTPSNEEETTQISQGEAFGSQSVEECQKSQTNAPPVLEAESRGVWESGRITPKEAELKLLGENGREGFDRTDDKPFSPSSSSNLLSKPQLNEDQPKETTHQSTLSRHDLAADDSLSRVKELPNLLSQTHRKEEQQQEPQNKPLRAEEDLNQVENLDASPEQAFNRLIKSHWEKTQRKEYKSQSIASAEDKDIENSITLFERWQRLLLTQEVMDSREAIAKVKKKLETLEHQIYDPTELINLLLPLIAEILSLKVAEAREEVADAIAPIIDEMIQTKSQQDKEAISSALAPVLPDAVAQQVLKAPGDFAKALAPEMGIAIKEQISLERDAMVDALYPVIGSTISKYMAEAIRAINEKVENTFSMEGISRKIRAKIKGVSEAELILQEAIPFTVQAIFLIHKGSGLVIAEVQQSGKERLESEMLAGMLTAIRSFVNDCIAQSGDVSEIDQIEYGNSQITLEVAGYCYLAVVTQGEPPKSFIQKTRRTLSTIVQKHSKSIELFDGDPSNVPEPIHQLLENLTQLSKTETEAQKGKAPVALLLISFAVVSAISLPLGIYQHLSAIDRRHEEETSLALASEPELALYPLKVDANGGTLKLSGRLPNQYLRSKAEQVAKKVEPKLKINNAIIAVEVPPDPVLAAAEVQRVTNILNQMVGAVIWTDYREGKVTVQGTVLQEADAQEITKAFQQIPGVKFVSNTVQLQPLAIASRVYFDQGSSELKSDELSKVTQIRAFLDQYPNKHLKLLGHTDPKGTTTENQQLALERATKVKDALVTQGVDPKRLQVAGATDPPLGVKAEQLPLLSRCVEFQMITP